MIVNEERKELILGITADLVSELLYYGRKEDEDLPVGQIEEAIEAQELSIDDIVWQFKNELYSVLYDE